MLLTLNLKAPDVHALVYIQSVDNVIVFRRNVPNPSWPRQVHGMFSGIGNYYKKPDPFSSFCLFVRYTPAVTPCFDNTHRWEEVSRGALGKQGISIHDMTACVRIRSEENCVGLKIFLPCFSGAPCIWSAAVAVKFLLLLCSCRSVLQEECCKKCGRKLLRESGYAGFIWRRMLLSVCNKTDV